MDELSELFERYVELLETGALETTGTPSHCDFADRLNAAAAVGAALGSNALDRLCSLLQEEHRILGWSYLPGESGAAAHETFGALFERAQRLRMSTRPPAW